MERLCWGWLRNMSSLCIVKASLSSGLLILLRSIIYLSILRLKRLCWGWLRNMSAKPLFCNIYLFLSSGWRDSAEDDWGKYQLSLYFVTSIFVSLLRMERLCWGWLRNISAKPLFGNIYIFFSPQNEEAVLRMTEPLFCNIYLSFSPQDEEAVLRMTEEYISLALRRVKYLSILRMKRLCWG